MNRCLGLIVLGVLVCVGPSQADDAERDPIPPGGGRLRNHWATCVVDMKSGHMAGLWDNISGRRLITESHEVYTVTTRDGREVMISEKDDRVHSAISTAPPPNRPRWGNAMVYFARNPKIPGSEIRKSYYFALTGDEQRIVCRSISITAPTKEPTLLSCVSHTKLAPRFRNSALYHYVVPQGVAGDQRPLVPASDIIKPLLRRDHGSDKTGRAASDLFHPGWKIGLSQYLFRVGRHWAYPVGLKRGTYWTRDGWQIASGGYIIPDKAERSRDNRIEMRFHITRGDRLAIHEEYLGLPEVAQPRQATTDRLQLAHVRTPGTPSRFLRPGDRVPTASLLNIGSGERGQFRYGDFLTSDDTSIDQLSAKPPHEVVQTLTGKQVRERLARLRSSKPARMTGVYIYRQHDSDITRAHPDWVLGRTKSGLVRLRQIPEVFDFEARGVLAESRYLGTEVFYVDAALDAGQVDWERRRVSQTSDAITRFKTLFDGLHKDNKLFWINGRTGSVYYDLSYYEVSGAHRVPGRTWRDGADMDLMNKIYQVPGTIHIPLYWWNNGPEENTQDYQNHCLALALSPRDGAWSIEVDGKLPVQPDNGALFEAIDEFRDARFARIGLEPAWWNDLSTNIEGYTLKSPGAWFLNAISHRDEKSDIQASLDISLMKLQPDQPIFCWQHQARRTLKSGQQYPSSAVDDYFTSRRLTILKPRAARLPVMMTDVPPEIVRLCTITQVPAWVLSTDGVDTQLRLPTTLGIHVGGRVDETSRAVMLKINGERRSTIGAWWNSSWGQARVRLGDTVVPSRIIRKGPNVLVSFELPRGSHNVVISR